jgi:hypothetical protein
LTVLLLLLSGWGTAVLLATAGGVAGSLEVAAAGAVCVAFVGLGMNMGFLPWLISHWSHNSASEKMKTNQRMMRRISFMATLFLKKTGVSSGL